MDFSNIDIQHILTALVVFVVFLISAKLLQNVLKRQVFPRLTLEMTVKQIVLKVVYYSLVAIGLLTALQIAGVDISTLLVLAGGLSVGIGFGLQSLVNNFISGFILLFEGATKPGDVINVDGIEGVVQSIELRSVHVITNDGIELIIPSSKLLEEVVINYTRSSAQVRLRISVGVSYNEDMAKVKSILLRAAEHPQVLKEPAPSVQLTDFGDSSVNFDVLVWISEAAQAARIRSDVRFQIWDQFAENGIEIPFPQRVVHMKGKADDR